MYFNKNDPYVASGLDGGLLGWLVGPSPSAVSNTRVIVLVVVGGSATGYSDKGLLLSMSGPKREWRRRR